MNNFTFTNPIYADRPVNRKITVESFELFLSLKQGMTKWTTSCHIGRLKRFLLWLDGREVNKSTVEEYLYHLKTKGYVSSTLNSYIFFFRLLEKYFKDSDNQIDLINGFKASKVEKPYIEVLSPQEIKRLIDTPLLLKKKTKNPQFSSVKLDIIYRDVIMFLALSGCRFSECTEMKCKQIDIDNKKATFIHTKSKEARKVYLSDPLINILQKYLTGKDRESLVFTNCLGGKIHGSDFVNSLHARAKQLGITKRVYPHLFRHSFATQLLQSGVDVTMVSTILGHSDIKITFDNYVHLADETIKTATFRHPLIRQSVQPKEILKQIKEQLKGYNLEDDPRFTYELNDTGNSLQIKIQIKE